MRAQARSPFLGSGTFANRPGSAQAGALYFATDLGTGIMLGYNGTRWKPTNGEAIIASVYANANLTGTLVQTALANFAMPAGLLSANGALEVVSFWSFPTVTGSITPHISLAAASGIGGTLLYGDTISAGGGATQTSSIYGRVQANNATGAQTMTGNNGFGFYHGTTIAYNVGAINMVNASFLNFSSQLTIAGDSCTLINYIVKWLEP